MSTLERKRVKVLKTAQVKNIFKNKPKKHMGGKKLRLPICGNYNIEVTPFSLLRIVEVVFWALRTKVFQLFGRSRLNV